MNRTLRPIALAVTLLACAPADDGGQQLPELYEHDAEWQGVASCDTAVVALHLSVVRRGDWISGTLHLDGHEQRIRGVAGPSFLSLGDEAYPFIGLDSIELDVAQSGPDGVLTGDLYDGDQRCSAVLTPL
jgi:hypothetical protein